MPPIIQVLSISNMIEERIVNLYQLDAQCDLPEHIYWYVTKAQELEYLLWKVNKIEVKQLVQAKANAEEQKLSYLNSIQQELEDEYIDSHQFDTPVTASYVREMDAKYDFCTEFLNRKEKVLRAEIERFKKKSQEGNTICDN